MKKAIWIAVGAALCLIAVCAYFVRAGQTEPGPRAVSKIGMLLNGSVEDQGYSQSQYEAMAAAAETEGLALIYQDRVAADSDFLSKAEEMIADGCGVIVCDSYLFDPWLVELAEAYPEIYFLNVSGTATAKNLSACLGRAYQVRYLSGLVAGRQTKTNAIGYVLAFLTPETIRQLNAFTVGVRKANPEATVYVRHTDDWNDGEKAAAAATALLEAHPIDVLTQHVNPISPLRIADERGVYTIGNNHDNGELFPRTALTSCVFDWEPFFAERIRECVQRSFLGRHYWAGLGTGLVRLAPLSNLVDAETREIVDAETERLKSGAFDVFYGPLTDIYGTLQVRENENLSDQQLLFGMYWFVDGVVVE